MIDGSAHVVKELLPYKRGKVYQLSESTVLKIGSDVKMVEVETMQLLAREAPNVPVPAVLHAYWDEERREGFIIMTKLEGEPLGKHWPGMTDAERESIVGQLSSYVHQWRQIRGRFIGAVDGGPCHDSIFLHSHGYGARPDASYGPFHSRAQYLDAAVEALRNSRPAGHRDALDEQTEARILAEGHADRFGHVDENDDGDMVLTHGDLHMGNILVKDGVVKGIVDWREAGYSIRECEYVQAKLDRVPSPWDRAIDGFVPAYPDQLALWQYVTDEMRTYSGV